MVDVERALLSTFIYKDLSPISDTLDRLELKEEWFRDPLHKIIAKCLIWLKKNEKGIDEVIVINYITKNNKVDLEKWMLVLAANSFGSKETIEAYIALLKKHNKRNAFEI